MALTLQGCWTTNFKGNYIQSLETSSWLVATSYLYQNLLFTPHHVPPLTPFYFSICIHVGIYKVYQQPHPSGYPFLVICKPDQQVVQPEVQVNHSHKSVSGFYTCCQLQRAWPPSLAQSLHCTSWGQFVLPGL